MDFFHDVPRSIIAVAMVEFFISIDSHSHIVRVFHCKIVLNGKSESIHVQWRHIKIKKEEECRIHICVCLVSSEWIDAIHLKCVSNHMILCHQRGNIMDIYIDCITNGVKQSKKKWDEKSIDYHLSCVFFIFFLDCLAEMYRQKFSCVAVRNVFLSLTGYNNR